MTIERMARCHPDTPASRIVDRDEITVVTIHKAHNQRTSRGPPDPEPTIEAFAVDVARQAGFTPKKANPCQEPGSSGRDTNSSSPSSKTTGSCGT